MSENALVPTSAGALIAQQQEAAALITKDCTGGKFLPQLRMSNSQSEYVKSGEVKPDQFVIIIDSEVDQDLGDEIYFFVCAIRNRSSKEIEGETYISFDAESDFYKEALAASENGDRTALAGRELLVYIPEIDIFVTFFFGNKTMRRTANSKFKSIVGKFCKCYPKQITTKARGKKPSNTYKSPTLKVGVEGFEIDDFDPDALNRAITKFNETEDKLPEVEDDEQDDR